MKSVASSFPSGNQFSPNSHYPSAEANLNWVSREESEFTREQSRMRQKDEWVRAGKCARAHCTLDMDCSPGGAERGSRSVPWPGWEIYCCHC